MSVAKMKDGKRWYVFVRYQDWQGNTKQHKKEGFERKADAKEYEKNFLAERTGSSSMTLESLYRIYMKDCESRLRPTTVYNKTNLYEKHILPFFGQIPVSDITPAKIRQWQNEMLTAEKTTGQAYSKTYLKSLHNQLSALFNFGVSYYGVQTNPCKQAGSMGRNNASEMQYWTVDEFHTFLKAVADDPKAVVVFSLLFWTGMRTGEMMALTLEDFDFTANTIRISKNYARHKNEDLILEPKTPKSNRTIVMTKNLSRILQQYISRIYGMQPGDRIFDRKTKTWARTVMDKACARCNVKRIRMHDLRHSHASLLIEMGYSPLLIAERLGHESVETTLRIYSHLYPNKQEQLATDLEKHEKCYDFATQDLS